MTILSRRELILGAAAVAVTAAVGVLFVEVEPEPATPMSHSFNFVVSATGTLADELSAHEDITLECIRGHEHLGLCVTSIGGIETPTNDLSMRVVIRHNGEFVRDCRLDEWSVRRGDTISITVESV